ncbi:ABC-2 type transport system ATP-binding protein [Paenibacillus sophorae]|uniref:ABC transporter ATP-binding protein n=1 Tax=Paenibacillus sophorae TaxID=1333845 RepID=A0A1H8SMB6_9BACL|nr:ABC transporter ATP-binding protein [Paenibacillus sophorae]QWU15478.1 ABC transporter ATP-binding protein [Paenibacillus sophorae]SEO79666.1 ABC-2 type transport system ATP-binding protein [Paenibacillus sophorae]
MPPLLQVSGLHKVFHGQPCVDGISFDMESGRCVALLGPNGAGKTTTLRMLAGLMNPSRGSILFEGKPIGDSYRRQIGYLPQSPSFYNWMTGEEYILLASKLSGMGRKESAGRAAAVLERMGLQDAARRRIGGYSGGMKQRLGLAQALVHAPRLLLLDEPVSALDPIGRREIMELLREIGKETSVIFSTHVLHDAEEVCDDIIMMSRGRIAEHGTLSSLRAKYNRPVITLRVEEQKEALQWLETLSTRSFILERRMEVDGTVLLKVQDMESARSVILREAAERGIPLLRFEAGSLSLEDVFMEAVGG